MTLLDSNVLIYASRPDSIFFDWAVSLIAAEVGRMGAFANPIGIAEVCVGDEAPDTVFERVQDWGVEIVSLPAAAAPICASAYRLYRNRRFQDSGKSAPDVPLPDFFIGAHAQIMGWEIATADQSRFSTYFPSVKIITPPEQLP